MKTLQKFTLMAFAVLSAGAANAQTHCTNCTPPAITAPPRPTDPGCRACSTAPTFSASRLADHTTAQPTSVNLTNSSSVLQHGDRQYACVEQIFGDNVASLVQFTIPGNLGRNDAYQSQYNPGLADNRMYGEQTGQNNFLVQRQAGSDNLAHAKQTGNGNIAGQSQGARDASGFANSSDMYLQQNSNNNVSVQYQRGDNQVSDVAQYGINGNWSSTVQLGTNNTVVVNQH